MTEAYNDALAETAERNIWQNLADEASSMSATEYATTTADIAGIFDPTPASDTIGAILSLAQGDLLGVGLSVLGYIPYAGDLGKIGKIGKVAPRTAKALEAVLKHSDEMASMGKTFLKNNFTLKQVAAARAKATKRVRKAMLDARNKVPGCKDCAKLKRGGRGQLQMPRSGGKWNTPNGKAPTSGTGKFTLDKPAVLPDGKKVTSIDYKNGFPQFDKYVKGGKHDLWEVSGNATVDSNRLTRQIRETNPGYDPPDPADYVLHHFEDGQVGYIPRTVHDRALGGGSHTGGNAVLNNDLF